MFTTTKVKHIKEKNSLLVPKKNAKMLYSILLKLLGDVFLFISLQLKRQGFLHVDALEPNEAMVNEAKKKCIYENYIVDFLTEKPTCIQKGMLELKPYKKQTFNRFKYQKATQKIILSAINLDALHQNFINQKVDSIARLD